MDKETLEKIREYIDNNSTMEGSEENGYYLVTLTSDLELFLETLVKE